MKDEVVQFVFILVAIVIAAAAEELLPSFFGIGFPVLLSVVMLIASRVNVLPGVMSAVAAGAFEDALSSLPPMSSICFFTIAALVSRKAYFPRPFLLAVFPAYAVWTSMCKAGPIGDALVSLMLSLPLGAVAFVIVLLVLTWAGGKAGFDE